MFGLTKIEHHKIHKYQSQGLSQANLPFLDGVQGTPSTYGTTTVQYVAKGTLTTNKNTQNNNSCYTTWAIDHNINIHDHFSSSHSAWHLKAVKNIYLLRTLNLKKEKKSRKSK